MKEKRNIPKQTGFKVPDNYFEDFKVDFSRNEVENFSTTNENIIYSESDILKILNQIFGNYKKPRNF